jgi:hydroxyacylglutathione hydrolase
MKLSALPAFADNYIWMLHDDREALVVDPGDAAPVKSALSALGLSLGAILVTHHHADHVGGIPSLQTGSIPVYGPQREGIPGVTHPVGGGDMVHWHGLSFQVLDTPGHTRGHIVYILNEGLSATDADPLAFVGDTLFSAGCGRLFEGSMQQLHESLNRLAQLPDHTRVCATHEYTLSNLRFAQAVEPDNPDIRGHLAHCQGLRAQNLPTLPSTVQTEKRINPFLRCDQPAVMAAALEHGAADTQPVSVFSALRLWKNTF